MDWGRWGRWGWGERASRGTFGWGERVHEVTYKEGCLGRVEEHLGQEISPHPYEGKSNATVRGVTRYTERHMELK